MLASLWLSSLKRQLRPRFSHTTRARRQRFQRHQLPSAQPLLTRNAAERLEDRTLLTSLLSVDDVTAGENETFTFQITLDEVAAADVTVRVNTQTDTASDNDYTFLSNKLVTIPAGELSTQVTIHVHDDEIQEADETFSLVLSDASLGGESLPADLDIADGVGQGTILNDDGLPGSIFTITGTNVIEGNSVGSVIKFTITRTGGSMGDLNFKTSVDFTTLNGTATAGEDYTAVTETVQFSAHPFATSQTAEVIVYVEGDTYQELSETVIGRLSNPTGGSLLKGNVNTLDAVGVIGNDDTSFQFQESFSADPVHANHTGDIFGLTVAIDGDIMVVGSPANSQAGYNTGVAYVYARNQQGTPADQTDDTWDYQTYLQAPVSQEDLYFAGSIAIDGDTIVIGARSESAGAVYVYTRVGNDWSTEAPLVERITVDGLYYQALFGTAVDIYEDTIVVGARYDTSSGTRSGAAYIFHKEGSDWSTASTRRLVQADPGYNDFFGSSVAIHGDIIVVGADRDNDNGQNSGAAYVYTKVGGSWITDAPLVAKLTASNGQAGDFFGYSVDTNGVDVVIGAYWAGSNGALSGSAYLYSRNGSDWAAEIELTGDNSGYILGRSVTLSENRLVVSTKTKDLSTGNSVEAAKVYTKNGDAWDVDTISTSVLTHPTEASIGYASAISISDNSLVIGASTASFNGVTTGAVYVYVLEAVVEDSWVLTNEIKPTEPRTEHNGRDNFGQAIAVSDEYMVISAPGTDSSLAPTGLVYVYAKNDGGTPDYPDDDTWVYETSLFDPEPEAKRSFGTRVDIDGDTIVVSADTTEFPLAAEVFVFTRNGSDWVSTPPTVTPLLANASRFLRIETSVSIQNDTIVVGNRDGSGNTSQSGVVYVYQKNGSDWSTIAPTETMLAASDAANFDYYGTSVDIDGDKIIVGAVDNEARGAAYLYQMGVTGWDSATETKLVAFDGQANDYFGASVAIEGNTVLVTSLSNSMSDSGAIYIFEGSTGWDDPIESKIMPSIERSVYGLGQYLSFSNNLLVVGGNSTIPGTSEQEGVVYLYDVTDGWNNSRETVFSYPTNSELYARGFGHAAFAINENNLLIAALNINIRASSLVYSYNRVDTAEFHLRVVDSPTSTTPAGEASSLPLNQGHVTEWAAYWVEIWVKSNALDGAGVFSTEFNFHYNTQITSATEIEFGSAFTQNRSGEIYEESGIVAGLSAETTAADLGTDDYLLFARIKFESLADDQVNLNLSGKSIGPRPLGFYLSDQEVKLVGDITAVYDPDQFYRANIYANPYDLNDDNEINFRDLILFASVYGLTPSESESDYAWFADVDQNDSVNFRDLIAFAANYGKKKSDQTPISYPVNFPDAWNQYLVASSQSTLVADAPAVTRKAAGKLFDSITEQVSPGLSDAQVETLKLVQIEVVDLAGEALGRAAGGTIYIDVNAAGRGWFVDSTPADHSEFNFTSELTLVALEESDAAGGVDLWTVILHELGHVLGYEHEETGLMSESLAPGVRHLPDWDDETDQFFVDFSEEADLVGF